MVGDPTLDRILASLPCRDRFRDALRTGARTLVALASTWGPQSLIRQRPDLPALLRAALPYDEYQIALLVHPNEHARLGALNLHEQLRPAIDAGPVLAPPHQGWASVLVAADVVRTRAAGLWTVDVAPARDGGRVVPIDPAAVVGAAHVRLNEAEAAGEFTCAIGRHAFGVPMFPSKSEARTSCSGSERPRDRLRLVLDPVAPQDLPRLVPMPPRVSGADQPVRAAPGAARLTGSRTGLLLV